MPRHPVAAALVFSTAILVVLAAGGAADARWFNPGVGVGIHPYYGVGVGYGGWGWGYGMGYGYGGGTAAGNYLQGMSQVVRAQGEYNKETSQAAINYQEARSKYIDNEKKWTETYFAMREKNQAMQAEKFARQKYSPEVIAQAARSAAPKPLSSEALDPITGKIYWPEVLLADEYAKPRAEIEHQLELRTSTGGGSQDNLKLQQATQEMISLLKGNIHNLPTGDYIAARKFLDGLAASARS